MAVKWEFRTTSQRDEDQPGLCHGCADTEYVEIGLIKRKAWIQKRGWRFAVTRPRGFPNVWLCKDCFAKLFDTYSGAPLSASEIKMAIVQPNYLPDELKRIAFRLLKRLGNEEDE